MIFKKIGRAAKNIFKGAKKAFKGVGKVVGSLAKNKFFKVALIAGAAVFTAGVAAAAIPAFGSTALATTLVSSTLTSGLFGAGSSFAGSIGLGTAAGAGLQTAAATGVQAAAGGAAASGAGAAAAPTVGAAIGAGEALGGAAGGLATMPATSAGLAVNVTPVAGIGATKGGLLAQLNNIGVGTSLLAGKIIEGAATPDEAAQERDALRRVRKQDNRWGVNNVTGAGFGAPTQMPGLLTQAARQRQPIQLQPFQAPQVDPNAWTQFMPGGGVSAPKPQIA